MPVSELRPKSNPDGSFYATWFDDEACLWDDQRLLCPRPLESVWQPPELRIHDPAAKATAVLFNPNALAVSQGVRDALSEFAELEFLPVLIRECGIFYILHVTSAIELPPGSKAMVAPPPSGNIVEVEAFPAFYEPPSAFFRVLQPEGAAARRLGATVRAIYLSVEGSQAALASGAGYLVARGVGDA